MLHRAEDKARRRQDGPPIQPTPPRLNSPMPGTPVVRDNTENAQKLPEPRGQLFISSRISAATCAREKERKRERKKQKERERQRETELDNNLRRNCLEEIEAGSGCCGVKMRLKGREIEGWEGVKVRELRVERWDEILQRLRRATCWSWSLEILMDCRDYGQRTALLLLLQSRRLRSCC